MSAITATPGSWGKLIAMLMLRSLLGAAWLIASSASASSLILVDQDRGVYSESTSLEAGQFDQGVNSAEAPDFSPFDESVQTTTTTTLVSADGSATLDSTLGDPIVDCVGSASTNASTIGADGRGEARADAFFELVFETDANDEFALTGAVSANAGSSGASDAFASVELFNLDAQTTLISHQASPGGSTGFGGSAMLQTGTRYRLTAFAVAHSLVNGGASSDFGDAAFDLQFGLPEPSGTSLLAAGIVFLTALKSTRGREA